jgi:hypothetical protein
MGLILGQWGFCGFFGFVDLVAEPVNAAETVELLPAAVVHPDVSWFLYLFHAALLFGKDNVNTLSLYVKHKKAPVFGRGFCIAGGC